MAQSKTRKRKGPSKGSKARSKTAKRGRKPRSKAGRAGPGKRRPTRKRTKPRHSRVPLVIILLMVAILIGGLFLISEYPDDKSNIQGGTVLGVVLCALFLFTQGQAPKGAPRSKRPRQAARSRVPRDDTEKPPEPSGPTITAAVETPAAISPAPLPLDVPMATLAPVTPLAPVATPANEPLVAPTAPLPLPSLAQSDASQARSPVHSRTKVPYPFNVGGGEFANTHVLINKDTILQLRTPLTAEFEPVPIPDYVSVAISIPKVPYQPPEEPDAPPAVPGAVPEVAPMGAPEVAVATTPEVAGVAPVAPVAATPMGVAPVAGQPAVAATPDGAVATPVAAVGVAPVAAVPGVPGVPAVATAAVAVTPGEEAPPATEPEDEDDMTVDFGDDDEDLEWG